MTSQSESSTANLISPSGKTGAVQMRIKNANAQHDRLSQTKSMILETSVEITKPVSRHRRNHSQHYISDKIVSKDMLVNKNKEGVLNKTKITDKGKKLRKNWTASYTVLSDHKLEFLKESKEQAASGLKSTTNPEVIDLWGAQIEWANEKSSRRNVFQVLVMWIGLTLYSRNPYAIQTVLRKDIHRHVTDWTNASQNPKCHGFNNSTRFTVTAAICAVSQTEGELLITTSSGSEFLLQSDEDVAIVEWFDAIKNTIDSLGTKQQFTPLGINLQKSSSTELLNLADEAKEKKNEHRKSLIFKLNYSASDTSDRNRVKTRLKKFISRRPSLKTLQEKGLIKDQVFGCHLETLCKRENTTVPHFVKQCIEAIEKRGLDADGIYRVSGNLSIIQKLRFIVNQEEKLNLDDSQWEDIHVVTGVLKMFFRELPEPLFPYSFFEQFVEAIKIQENDLRVKSIRNLVKKLPRPNYDTMKTLFEHLRKITIEASVNLMSTQSLGIVFGPTLLRPEMDKGNMAVCMVYQNQIVELMLMEYENIFC